MKRAPSRRHLQRVPVVAADSNLAQSQILIRSSAADDEDRDSYHPSDLTASAPASPLPASHAYNNNNSLSSTSGKAPPKSGIALFPGGAFNPAELRSTLRKANQDKDPRKAQSSSSDNNAQPEGLTVREILAERQRLKRHEADPKGIRK